MHHEISHAWKVTVYLTLGTFYFWNDHQVLRKANNPTDMTCAVPDEEYTASLQPFVSICFRHSQYVVLVHDAMSCSGKLSADVFFKPISSFLEATAEIAIDGFSDLAKIRHNVIVCHCFELGCHL